MRRKVTTSLKETEAMLEEVCGKQSLSISEETGDVETVSPFIKYEDGYAWPDVYTELDEMMESNIVIYPLAELRAKARSGKFDEEGTSSILNLPLTHADVMDTITRHEETLFADTKVKEAFYRDVFQTAQDRHMMQAKTALPNGEQQPECHLTPTSIIAFDDEFANEELVYSIEVNHPRKRLTVCFRGSVTKADWATDFEIYMKEVQNPMRGHSSQQPLVRIHNGFHSYLFEPSSRGAKGPNGEELSEYEEIMQMHVFPVIREYPDYKVCRFCSLTFLFG